MLSTASRGIGIADLGGLVALDSLLLAVMADALAMYLASSSGKLPRPTAMRRLDPGSPNPTFAQSVFAQPVTRPNVT
jgi:hypothetical protein